MIPPPPPLSNMSCIETGQSSMAMLRYTTINAHPMLSNDVKP